ncbi:MAG: DUF4163 domain-containing protein [Acidaminococcaceae bacterium]|jgi:hypothetical protein|nr:DUF4163 domain-containing protein [Acidaminococcaceae bacterium]
MRRWVFLVLMLCLLALPVEASVQGETIKGAHYVARYPVVTANNAAATAAINKDLRVYVDKFVSAMEQGTPQDEEGRDRIYYRDGATGWELMYEDPQVISLRFQDYYYSGGAHGMHYDHGLVYDKNTGARIPLRHYLRITPSQLAAEAVDHLYTLEGEKLGNPRLGTVQRVPQDYFLLKGGVVCPVFTLYELVAYSCGSPIVKISPARAAFYNRINK